MPQTMIDEFITWRLKNEEKDFFMFDVYTLYVDWIKSKLYWYSDVTKSPLGNWNYWDWWEFMHNHVYIIYLRVGIVDDVNIYYPERI